MAAVIGSLSVKLGLVTLEWDKATDKAKAQAKELQKAFNELGSNFATLKEHWKTMGGSLSAGAIGMSVLLKDTLDFTNQILDLSKAYGITTSETLAFRNALTESGASADNASKIMSSLFSKIEDGQKGTEATLGQFEKLGISFSDLKAMSPYDAITKVASGFANINNQFEKTKLIKEFFGKGGIGINIADINKVLAEGSQKYDKYGAAIESVGEISDTLKRSFDNLKIAFAYMIAPFAHAGVSSIEKFSGVLASIVSASVLSGFVKLVPLVMALVVQVKNLAIAGTLLNTVLGKGSIVGLAITGASALIGYATYKSMSQEEPTRQEVSGKIRKKTTENLAGELGKEATILQNQITLQNTLAGIDEKRLKLIGQENEKGELYTKTQIEQLGLQEKIVQINTKRAAELEQSKDKTEGYKKLVNDLADAEIKRAKTNTSLTIKNLQTVDSLKQKLKAEDLKAIKDSIEYIKESNALDILGLRTNEEFVAVEKARAKANEDIKNIKHEADKQRLEKPSETKDINAKELLQIEERNAKLTAEVEILRTKSNLLDETSSKNIAQAQKINELELQKMQLDSTMGLTDFERSIAKERYDQQIALSDLEDKAARARKAQNDREAEDLDNQIKLKEKLGNQTLKNMQFEEKAKQVNIFGENLAALGKYSRAAFETWKAFQISKTIIDTLSGARAAYSALADIPIVGPVLGTAAAAVALGAGMANVAAIRAQQFQGRAKGGDISGGTPYMVGEKGPELIVPGRSGTVVPNHTLMDAVGNNQKPVVNNYTINAIDTKSFDDRLLASSNTIWAANMYANKGLATGRGRA